VSGCVLSPTLFSGGPIVTCLILRRFITDQLGEVDEKAILIAVFVLAAVVGLSPLGKAVSNLFLRLAGMF